MRLKVIATLIMCAQLAACNGDLAQAFEDVRTEAPSVCKDYCEDKISCEWPSVSGPEYQEAFASAIRQCEVNCAWYAHDGAYASSLDTTFEFFKTYDHHIGGGRLIDAFRCAYRLGAYRCTDDSGSSQHIFAPPSQTVCEDSGVCLEGLGAAVDFSLAWTPTTEDGGICDVTGIHTVEAMFF